MHHSPLYLRSLSSLFRLFLAIAILQVYGFAQPLNLPPNHPTQGVTIKGIIRQGSFLELNWDAGHIPGLTKVTAYQTTSNIYKSNLDYSRFPITATELPTASKGTTILGNFGHNSDYNIQLALEGRNGTYWSNILKIKTAEQSLPSKIVNPYLIVSKNTFIVSLFDRYGFIKSYPMVLGKDPLNPKWYQDRRTTPEGVYKITRKSSEGDYGYTLDLNYPNSIDQQRYQLLKSKGLLPEEGKGVRDIGGGIQLHGDIETNSTLNTNWTHGCMALRNEDIAELFNLQDIKTHTPVYIVGDYFNLGDLNLIRSNHSPEKLRKIELGLVTRGYSQSPIDGRFSSYLPQKLLQLQLDNKLPLTGVLDQETIDFLLKPTELSL